MREIQQMCAELPTKLVHSEADVDSLQVNELIYSLKSGACLNCSTMNLKTIECLAKSQLQKVVHESGADARHLSQNQNLKCFLDITF